MRAWTRTLGIVMLVASAAPAGAADLSPFVARYSAKYTWLSVGEIQLDFRRGQAPGTWVMQTRGDPGGVARLITSATLLQGAAYWTGLLQGLVAGSLLHVVFHRHATEPAGGSELIWPVSQLCCDCAWLRAVSMFVNWSWRACCLIARRTSQSEMLLE